MLHLEKVSFEKNVDESILKKFAKQFNHLEKFKLTFWFRFDENVLALLLFWKLLKPVIDNNKCFVALDTHYSSCQLHTRDRLYMIEDTISKAKLSVNKFNFSTFISKYDLHEWTACSENKIIQNIAESTLEYIKISNMGKINGHYVNEILKHLEKDCNTVYVKPFASLKVIEVKDCDPIPARWAIKLMNRVLKLNIITKNSLFVIAYFQVEQWKDNNIHWGGSFKKISNKIFELLSKQIPIDIKIRLKKMAHTRQSKQCQKVLKQKRTVLQRYKSPKCNKLCLGLMKPHISFVNIDCDARLHVTNVEKNRII